MSFSHSKKHLKEGREKAVRHATTNSAKRVLNATGMDMQALTLGKRPKVEEGREQMLRFTATNRMDMQALALKNKYESGIREAGEQAELLSSVSALPHEQVEQEPVPIALLGDPVLRLVAKAVVDVREPAFLEQKTLLMRALREFRALHGFGRAISAPQISVSLRFIAVNLSGKESTLINPVITWKSRGTFTMWDDCMSFPSLMVRVRRHNSISLNYTDEEGQPQSMLKLDQATSELLQHEMDHLDGVLSVDLALDKDAIVDRRQFEAQPAYFRKMVDYTIS